MGRDPRQAWVAKFLRNAGLDVVTEIREGTEAVVLPMSGQTDVPWTAFPHGAPVFTGRPPEDPPEQLRFVDYGRDERVTARNAVPTAEGAIQIAMEQLNVTLWRSNCLVVGFGRIGKVLARVLHGLGANVTVSARSAADRGLIEALGYEADETGVYSKGLDYACVFNTVPAPVLPEAQLLRVPRDCLLIDLASRPGGVDFNACRALGLQAVHALSLPGKAAPATAGRIIADFILNALE